MRDKRVRVLVGLALAMGPVRAAVWCQGCVAIVESLSGEATVRAHGAKDRTAAMRLEWLPAGSTIEVGANSRATLFLLNGQHYELGAGARATVTADALAGAKGPVRQLAALPPIGAAAIAGPAPRTAGVTRFRGSSLRDLYPRDDMAVLAASAKLSFRSVADASGYQVKVEDEERNPLFELRTESTEVTIPEGTLQAGKRYLWRVEALRSGELDRAEASFVTVSEEDLARRAAFAKAMQGIPDQGAAMALRADVDFRLGLLREAREEFQAALRMAPEEAAIRRALEAVQSALSGAAQ